MSARAGILYLAGNLLSAAVPFLLMPLLTRVLAPAEYGAIVGFFVLIAWCTPVAGLSMHGALGVAWFRKEPGSFPGFAGNALILATGSTVLVALLVAVCVLLLPQLDLGFGAGIASMAAIAAGANILLQCRLVLWQNQQKPLANVSLQVGSSVLNMALSMVGVLALGWAAEGRILGSVSASLLIAIVAVLHLCYSGMVSFRLRLQDLRELAGFGVPLVPHGLAGALLANGDRFIVSVLLGSATLGVYGAAAQLGSLMNIAADAFVKAFNPWLFSRLRGATAEDRLQAVGAMYMALPSFLVLGALAWLALHLAGSLLLGSQYRAALSLLPWFMFGGACSGVYLAISGLFFYESRTAALSAITFPVALVGLGVTAWLVSLHGAAGAAMGYALVQLLLAVVSWWYARRAFGLPFDRPGDALRAWRIGLTGMEGSR
jgi:O-antigen/teichoic acid export membrane protein